MEGWDLSGYEISGDQGGQVNKGGSCTSVPTGHFGRLVAEGFDVLSGLVHKPRF